MRQLGEFVAGVGAGFGWLVSLSCVCILGVAVFSGLTGWPDHPVWRQRDWWT